MKKIFNIAIIFCSVIFLCGSGYKGTLPDLELNLKQINYKQEKQPLPKSEILPLDKLTIPVKHTVKIDKIEAKYKNDITELVRQLTRMQEVLKNDKSFKNFVAAANVFDLTSNNLLNEFNEERFQSTNKIISDINHDITQIKNYWIAINKNVQYVSSFETNGTYSPSILNEQLNKFANTLQYPIRELNLYLGIKE